MRPTIAVALALVAGLLAPVVAAAAEEPGAVQRALELAGDNRAQLETVLAHYRDLGDAQKLAAARFLIGNMEGHGYAMHGFFAGDTEIEFDALSHRSYEEAQAAMDAMEKIHGPIEYRAKRFDKDLETITAPFLIEHIDLAFEAWRERPWASGIPFEVFCEHILPYRGSNEPLEAWRRPCIERLADAIGDLADPTDLAAVTEQVHRTSKHWVGFSTLYYLHPTDQGYAQMSASRRGRCEDMSNMMGYAFRASAVVAAQDYTPFWADRDNNHAWEVRLDAQGHGRAGLSNRAAKVYRKVFSMQAASLGAIKGPDEEVPRWLSGRNFIDVTADYQPTTDVTVPLTEPAPEGARFAYLCVFNGGEWQAIHWGRIEDGAVTFTAMGRHIAYLPAYYAEGALRPAAPPLILTREGAVRTLAGGAGTMTVTLRPKGSEAEEDEGPVLKGKPGTRYELSVWENGWSSRGSRLLETEEPVAWPDVPADHLYWMVAEGSRRLERIFTIEGGARVNW
jgi:hypothetical protein